MLPVNKIISGGQTGADQAALDGAICLGIDYGGWLPPCRMTERGPLSENYVMQVLEGGGYPERTRKNVEDSHGTLIISHGKLTGGSALTARYAARKRKPWLHINLDLYPAQYQVPQIRTWLLENEVIVLNVAGPRESSDPKIYKDTLVLLKSIFGECLINSEGE